MGKQDREHRRTGSDKAGGWCLGESQTGRGSGQAASQTTASPRGSEQAAAGSSGSVEVVRDGIRSLDPLAHSTTLGAPLPRGAEWGYLALAGRGSCHIGD